MNMSITYGHVGTFPPRELQVNLEFPIRRFSSRQNKKSGQEIRSYLSPEALEIIT